MKLTEAQVNALRSAARIADSGEYDGATPKRGQYQMFERLRLAKLLKYEGQGCHVDNMDREVPIYTITRAGRKALEHVRRA